MIFPIRRRKEFSNGLTKEQRVEPKVKRRRRIIFLVSLCRQNNDKVFKLAEKKKKKLIMYWSLATTNANVAMKYDLKFSLQDYKKKSIEFLKLLLNEFSNLHLVRSFDGSDLLISIVIKSIVRLCILFFVFL